MSATFDKKIPMALTPLSVLFELDESAGTLARLWTFDNLASNQIVLRTPAAADSGGENVDIQRGDGAVIRFKKISLTLDGTTEEEIVASADTDSNATGKFEVTMVTNEAPIKVTTDYTGFTAFISDLAKKRDDGKKFLLLAPMSVPYSELAKSNPTPDGYFIGFVKIDGDITLPNGNAPAPLTITLKSYKVSGVSGLALVDVTGLGSVQMIWKRGGAGKNYTLTKDLSTFTQGNFDLIAAGEGVFI